MTDPSRTNQKLLEDYAILKQRIQELERSETEHKQAEEYIKQSEKKFATAFLKNSIPMAITTVEEGSYLEVSEAFLKLIGLDRREVIGNTSTGIGFITPEQRQIVLNELGQKGSVENLELQMRTKGGELRYGLFNSVKISLPGEDHLLTVVTDITDRKQAEDALRESENWYRTIFENTGTATVILDENTTIILANAEYEKLSGYTKNELEGKKSWTDFVVKEDLERMMASHRQRRIDNTAAPKSYEFRFKNKKGHIKNIFLTIDVIPGTKRSVASLLDITEHKQMEAVLQQEHQKLISILDGIPVSAFVIDDNSWVIMWNLVNEFFTGISKEQVLGKKIDLSQLFKDKAPPILAELVLRMTDEEILDKFAKKGIWKTNIHPEAFESIGSIWINEKEHIMAIQATRLRNAQGDIVGAIQCAQDITESKHAEEERERLISELQKALSEVKILSGLLPICASCKNIRDDKGYWSKIESYISTHSQATFTHDICPTCAKKLYPDIYKKLHLE